MKKENKSGTINKLNNSHTSKSNKLATVNLANVNLINDVKNENPLEDFDLYLNLLDNLSYSDGYENTIKTLKNILIKEPNNSRIKQLLAIIQQEQADHSEDEDDDIILKNKNMKLNSEGEYEYIDSEEEIEEKN